MEFLIIPVLVFCLFGIGFKIYQYIPSSVPLNWYVGDKIQDNNEDRWGDTKIMSISKDRKYLVIDKDSIVRYRKGFSNESLRKRNKKKKLYLFNKDNELYNNALNNYQKVYLND